MLILKTAALVLFPQHTFQKILIMWVMVFKFWRWNRSFCNRKCSFYVFFSHLYCRDFVIQHELEKLFITDLATENDLP